MPESSDEHDDLFRQVHTWSEAQTREAEALVSISERTGDAILLAKATYGLAIRAYLDGDHVRCAEFLDRGLGGVDSEACPQRWLLLANFRAIAFIREGSIIEAIELLTPVTLRGIESAVGGSDLATAMGNLAECYLLLGDLSRADALFQTSYDIALSHHDLWMAFQVSFKRLIIADRRGDEASVQSFMTDVLRLSGSNQTEAFAEREGAIVALMRARIALDADAPESAILEIQRAEQSLSRQGDDGELYECVDLLTRCHLRRGDLDAAAADAERAVALAAKLPGSASYHRALRLAGEVAKRRGDLHTLHELLERAASPALTRRKGDPASVVGHYIERHQQRARIRDEELASANHALRRTKRALERSRDAAIAKAETRKQFLGQMSHELRTPLHGVIGTLELLRSTPLTDEQQELVLTIQRSADLTLGVVDDILDLGKLEAGELRLEARPYAIRPALTGVVSALRRREGPPITLTVADDVPQTVLGESRRVQQVLMNLIGNAIKYSEATQIVVRVSALPDERLRVEVEDDGVGIDAAALESLFDPYVQASEGRRHRGTGLGLAIARALVETAGGTIGASSTVGAGSLFWLELPLPACAALERDEEATRQDLSELRVLLAEDNDVNRRLMERQLRQLGAEVRTVVNGQQAVEAALSDPPDLVLMDLHMPVLDGDHATRRLREAGFTRPVLALTASVMQDDRKACLEAGMNGFLTKPLVADRLLRAVEDLLGPKERALP